jgi:hypothetical protein
MILESYVKSNKEAFLAKVESVAQQLGIDPDWLMGMMYKESTLNARAVNSITGATGLIQFMPATALDLGTTTQALLAMDNVQQLDFVYKYLYRYKGKMTRYVDVYMAVFFPAAIGKPEDWVLQTSSLSASKITQQNTALDYDKSGTITVAEVEKWATSGIVGVELLKKKL